MLNKLIHKICNRNYHLARLWFMHTLEKKDISFSKSPLLIYQMGKVGSSTIDNSLLHYSIDRNVYHVHFLVKDRVDEYEQKRKRYFRTPRFGLLAHIWEYQHLYKKVVNTSQKEPWKVITLVRDPVARNLATFFENTEVLRSDEQGWEINSDEYGFKVDVKKDDLSELVQIFFDKMRHNAPGEFFDREFNGILDIDLFSEDFDFDAGYKIYKTPKVEVLLLRLEDLNRVAADAMKEFLGIEDFELHNKNIGSGKDYSDVYTAFKDVIQLPKEYIDSQYDSKFARQFYSEAEIAAFKQRWVRE